ncbi:MAG: LamG-like jellyroll fold domain-containing protein [Planctomycetota bacterium]
MIRALLRPASAAAFPASAPSSSSAPILAPSALSAAVSLLALSTSLAAPLPAAERAFEGRFFRGAGDRRHFELLEFSRRIFEPDPEYQCLPMLYAPEWNGFVEGPTWNMWWIQNSYGTTYCALPFLEEPYLTFLQNSQDLWFDQMGDGKRLVRWGRFEWIVPDGQLCDAASPGQFIPKQGDGRVEIHDWGVEFTAAGLLLQAELLLIARDAAAIERYISRLERSADFLETRRDPANDLFLAGPAGNLLAPSYAGWKRPDGTYGMAYLAGLSVTTIAALDRLVELERFAGRESKARLYAERRERARRGLPRLLEPEGYFVKSIDPDGTRHGVFGAPKHGYFEAVANHDAVCFRVADDALSRKIYGKMLSIPGLRPHGVVITNCPSLDDMYTSEGWLWGFGTWVNGGHWSTCEARVVMGYHRLGLFEDARRSIEHLLRFANAFRMDNPLVEFGGAVYQPGEAINLCYDNFGPPAAMVRGLFEYLYDAEGVTLVPHIPPEIEWIEQRFPVRLGRKRLWLAAYGSGPVREVRVAGKPHERFDSERVRLREDELPEEAAVEIALGEGRLRPFEPDVAFPPPAPPGPDRTEAWARERFPPIAANDLPLRIGADSHGGSRFLGEIARARVFARALGAEEIRALYEGAPGGPAGDPSLVVDLDFAGASLERVPNAARKDLFAKVVGKVEFADSPRGRALRLGGEGYLEIADRPELDLSRASTLEAWIAPRALPPGGARIIDKTTVGASDGYLLDTCPGNSLRAICQRATLGHDARLEPGRWAHVAAAMGEDGTLALYLDGRLVASETRKLPPELDGLHERVEKAYEAWRRLEGAGLARTYEAAHARLVLRAYEACAERFRRLAEGTLAPLPARSQSAADHSYVATGRKLAEGLERALARGAARPPVVRVFPEPIAARPIDPKQGGQFIEPLCGLLPSLIAQQVASTSFEEEPPWNVEFRREVDRPHRPWYPDGAVHVARCARDPDRPQNGSVSLRIEIAAPGAEAGISQDGFALEEGRAYRLRLQARGRGRFVLRAALRAGGSSVAGPVELGSPSEEWGPAEAVLRARRAAEDATLAIFFSGPGTAWIDRVYLIEEGAVLGLFRRDVVEAIRALSPGVIRFGGSAIETYEWEKCIGPWDERAPFPQGYWGGIEENFVGVEEFVELCREVGAEPLICVRWSGKKPEDAAAEVEYLNGAPDTRWGSLRARNGHREPYGVRYWQVGNEVSGPEYDDSLAAFAEAMRRADPSIRVLSSGPSEDTLRKARGTIDYLAPHHYGCADLEAMEASFAWLRREIARFALGRDVRVAVTEWNTTAGDWGLGRASLQTLGNALACARYHNLLQRHADLVEIAIRSNLADSFGSGAILPGPGRLHVSPAYHAQRLYARATGSRPLRVEEETRSELDLSAALTEDGSALRLYAVNPGPRRLERLIRLEGLGRIRGGTKHVLADSRDGGTPDVLNSRDDPERVSVAPWPIRAGGAELRAEIAPWSLALFEIELSR